MTISNVSGVEICQYCVHIFLIMFSWLLQIIYRVGNRFIPSFLLDRLRETETSLEMPRNLWKGERPNKRVKERAWSSGGVGQNENVPLNPYCNEVRICLNHIWNTICGWKKEWPPDQRHAKYWTTRRALRSRWEVQINQSIIFGWSKKKGKG
jgi:hypothetical protein